MPRPLALLLLLAAASCSDQGPPPGVDEEIVANYVLWQATRPASYRYTVERQCFCSEEWRGPVVVEVVGDQVVARSYAGTGAPVPTDAAEVFPSVDGLYRILEDAVQAGAHQIQVTWDSATGLPLSFWIDYEERVADEEQGYQIVALPTPR